MIINFFLQSRDFGGAEQFANDLILAMAKKNHQVILYSNNQYLLKNLQNKNRVTLHKTPIHLDFSGNYKGLIKSLLLAPMAIFSYLKIFKNMNRTADKQIVLYSGFSEKIIPGSLAKLFNLPIYFIEYGPLEPLFKKLLSIPKILYFLSKNQAKKVIVPSNSTKIALKNIFAEQKIILIPCGTNLVANKHKKETGKKMISVISRLEKGKGQDLAIKAFSLVEKEMQNVQLQIIGEGNFYHELKKIAKNNPKIKFLKYVQNKQEILKKSDIILCPSVWPLEGFGLTIVEAMAFAKPIVAFDRAPGNEILAHKKSALLAKNEDCLDLAEKIIRLLKNEKLQKKLSDNAHETFIKKYEISMIAQKYLDLFEK